MNAPDLHNMNLFLKYPEICLLLDFQQTITVVIELIQDNTRKASSHKTLEVASALTVLGEIICGASIQQFQIDKVDSMSPCLKVV